MEISTAQLSAWLGAFLWPFMRIGTMLLMAPIFGARMIPVRVRLALALALTWMVSSLLPPAPALDPISAEGLLTAFFQVLIGAAMGFALQLVFSALVVGGQVVAMSMGLGFASMVDPQNGVQVPVLSQYYVITATLLFLALNGHLVLIQVVADSFHTLPVGMEGLTRTGFWDLVAWAGRMFMGGVLIALPAVTALMLTNLAFGIVTRAAPQLNIFAVGFPVTMTLGFVILLVTLPDLLPRLSDLLTDNFMLMQRLTAGRG